jgi:stage IV sporulation protein FB
MGWQDRPYNRGSEGARGFLSNPGSILQLSVPFGRWFGTPVRLHFWLLLTFLFILVGSKQGGPALLGAFICCIILLAMLLVHEFAHRTVARWLGGGHEEFMLWPMGGMTPVRTPANSGAQLLGNLAGPAANLIIGAIAMSVIYWRLHMPVFPPITNPLIWIHAAFGFVGEDSAISMGKDFGWSLLFQLALVNAGLVIINLLPFYWFDGGAIWEAFLWRPLSRARAMTIVCIAGMILAVVMFAFSLFSRDLFGMILWLLLASSSFVKMQDVKANHGIVDGDNSSDDGESWKLGKKAERNDRKWTKKKLQQAKEDREEQARIDAILAKVHDHGLHSLTYAERRALKKATERQRKRDLAERY